jgi:hypothetical protein
MTVLDTISAPEVAAASVSSVRDRDPHSKPSLFAAALVKQTRDPRLLDGVDPRTRDRDPHAPAGVFAEARAKLERETGPKAKESQAREAAQEFVAVALVQPVLQMLRETNQAAGPFAPGAHEKQFGPLLDAELSKRITEASHFPLVDRLARDLLKHEQPTVQEALHG